MLSKRARHKGHIRCVSIHKKCPEQLRPEQANPQRHSRVVVARNWRQGAMGVTAGGDRISFGGDENVPELDRGDSL